MKLPAFTLAALATITMSHSANGEIVVQNYFLQSRVSTAGLDPDHTQAVNNNSPVPTSFSQFAHVDPSFCSTGYQMDWTGDSAQFDITSSHRLQGYQGSVSSGGWWVVRPAVESLVTFNGFFNYNHPASPALLGTAAFQMYVRLEGSPNNLFSTGGSGGTFSLDPPIDTFLGQGSFVLSAGTLYRVGFAFNTLNWTVPPSDAIWLGNGEVHIAINPVPEPATPALLATVVPFLIHRRRLR